MRLLKVQGTLSRREAFFLGVLGIVIVIGIWLLLTMGESPLVPAYILPHPWKVLTSFPQLYTDNDIIRNTCLSLGLNLAGYIEAILISLPIGFIIGLYPFFKGGFQRQVDAIRYVPLTAVTGLFIVWFGTGTAMKVHFLAFGILIYLLPVIVQRISEVDDVYLKTVYTLGATDWQTIKTVYIPSVLSRISDDIRVLTAISWTYIIVAESIDNTGGIGGLIWRVGIRQGRVDKVFAMLIIIILIGVIQDKLFVYLDRLFFPHKYQTKRAYETRKPKGDSALSLITGFIRSISSWLVLSIYLLLLIDSFTPILAGQSILPYLFGKTDIAIHFLVWCMILFKGWQWWREKRDSISVKSSTAA